MSVMDLKGVSGVYRITHVPSGACYVGASKDVLSRWFRHQWRLNHGRYEYGQRSSFPRWQALWNLWGREAFRIELLERCDPRGLHRRETHWIAKLRPELNANGRSWSSERAGENLGSRHRSWG